MQKSFIWFIKNYIVCLTTKNYEFCQVCWTCTIEENISFFPKTGTVNIKESLDGLKSFINLSCQGTNFAAITEMNSNTFWHAVERHKCFCWSQLFTPIASLPYHFRVYFHVDTRKKSVSLHWVDNEMKVFISHQTMFCKCFQQVLPFDASYCFC